MSLRQFRLTLLFLVLSSIALSFDAPAATITLQGSVHNAPSSVLRVFEYGDYISFRERELSHVKLNSNGQFKVSFRMDEPGLLLLAVENYRGRIFVEPGKDYSIEAFLPARSSAQGNYFSTGSMEVKVQNEAPDGLNGLITTLELSIDSFITREYERIYLRRDRRFVRQFVDSLGEAWQHIHNPYFATYLEYSLGYLEYMGNLRTWESMRLKYFRGRKVEYQNPAYMDLFSSIFEKYFIYYSKVIELDPLIGIVNSGNPSALYNLCMADTALQGDPALTELVLLLNVNDMFHLKDFRKESVFAMLQSLKSVLRNPMSKLVAINLMDQNASMIPGLAAPAFEGIDLNREKKSLRDYRGKTVLLVFWDSSCPVCRDEFSFIAPYLRTKADSLLVLTVNVDRSFESFASALKSMPAGLEYLYAGQDLEMLDSYRISGLPLYILLDTRGDIIENPTVSPGADPNHFLLKIFGIR